MNKIIDKLICIKNNTKFGIIMSKEKYNYLELSLKEENYSILLIHVLLNEYYYNLIKIFKSNKNGIEIYIKNNNTIDTIYLDDRVEFIEKLDKISKLGLLDSSEIKKIKYLKSTINYENLLPHNKFKYYYEQKEKEISVCNLIKLFKKDNESFIKQISKCNDKRKDELLVILISFTKKYLNKNNYIMPENIKKNAEYILNIGKDYEVLNKIKFKKRPKYLKKAKLNNELINDILNQIPDDFTTYEKALYSYIYLCKYLTHDEHDVNKCNYIINHKNIRRIKKINKNNNIVVCYEFAVIYALILDRLNIKYEILGDTKYGRGHIYLSILYKDAKICIDGTRGLFECDLTRVKNGIKTCGFVVEKSNPKTLEEIEKSYEKVYNYIEKNNKKTYYYETELIKNKRLENKYDNIDFDKKINLFYNEICSNNLPPVDKIKNIRLLKKIIFGKNTDIDMCIIMNNSKVSSIFTIKKDNHYEYYLYTNPNKIINVTKECLEAGFRSGCYEYINVFDEKIEGIETQEKKKIKR